MTHAGTLIVNGIEADMTGEETPIRDRVVPPYRRST